MNGAMNSQHAMPPMVKIYRLSEELAGDPEQVVDAQALTLDETRPHMGLKGSLGLFGSSEWWESIQNGIMPQRRVSGVIKRVFVAGQDRSEIPNAFDMITPDGVRMEGIYVNSPEDVAYYEVGRRVEVVYALDELKMALPSGEKNHLEIVIEVSISS